MTLKTSVGSLEAGATLGAVAARAQAGLSEIEYELTVVGDIANSLEFFAAALDGLPIMGTFDYEAYAYFKSRQKALRRLFIALAPQRPTTVIAAELLARPDPTAYKKAMSIHYAMRCILDGLPGERCRLPRAGQRRRCDRDRHVREAGHQGSPDE
jgi:hypothetical protein